MASKGSTKGRKGEKQNGNGISDERFAAAQTDPRFHRFPRSKSKVEIDKRFSGLRLFGQCSNSSEFRSHEVVFENESAVVLPRTT